LHRVCVSSSQVAHNGLAAALQQLRCMAGAALDISRVCALSIKAMTLSGEARTLSAVDKYGDAIAAAAALQQRDCLIVAMLQVQKTRVLYNLAFTKPTDDDDESSELSRCVERANEAINLLLTAVETLRRREAAGTLFEGATHETAFYQDVMRRGAALRHESFSADHAEVWARRFGYVAYMSAAGLSMRALSFMCVGGALRQPPAPQQRGDALAAATFLADFAERALALLAQSHTLSDGCNIAESELVRLVQDELPDLVESLALTARLRGAWQRVVDSGVLLARPFEYLGRRSQNTNVARYEAAVARDADRPLRACALPSCGKREKQVAYFKLCARCGRDAYCSKAHQVTHWPQHKTACKKHADDKKKATRE
jgi:uncharacterized protein with PIN domain/ribosomal protein L37E